MNPLTQFVAIATALLTLFVVIDMLRRRRFKERHAIWWLIAGVIALVVSIFPQLLNAAAIALGVEVPINLVFFLSIAVLFLVCIQNSAELTALEEKTRTLAEEVALLKMRLDDSPPRKKPTR